jgi:hypothetical protein
LWRSQAEAIRCSAPMVACSNANSAHPFENNRPG